MRILTIRDTCQKVGVSRTKLWQMIRDRKFPKPVHIDGQRKGLIDSEVDTWIRSRIAERDSEAAA